MARSDGTIYIDVDLLVEKAKKQLDNFQDTLKKSSEKVTSVGKKLTTNVTAPIVGGFALAIKEGAQFEGQMSRVGALSGAVGDELEAMTDLAREYGSKTTFSAYEAAQGLEYMALSAWDAQQMTAGLPHVLALAEASQLDLGRTTDIVVGSLNMFGLQAEEANRVADVLAKTSTSTSSDVDGIAESLKYFGSNASSASQDIETATALVGTLANVSTVGSSAGTVLNAVLRDMKKNSEDGAIAIGKTKIALYDSSGNFRDMVDIVEDLIGATDGMTDAQRDAALSTIFGDEAIRGIIPLIGEQGEGLRDLRDSLYDAGGTATDMSKAMNDNLIGAFKSMQSAMSDLFISVYNTIEPTLKTVVEALTVFFNKLNSAPDSVKTLVVVIGAIVAAIGPLLIGIGMMMKLASTFTTGLGAVTTALGALSKAFIFLATNPIGWVILGITALIAIGVLLYKNWDEIVAWCKKTWETLATFFTELGATISDILSRTWQGIKEFSMELWGSIVEVLTNTWTGLTDFLTTTWTSIKDFFVNTWNNILEFVTTVLTSIRDFFTAIWTGILTFIQSVWTGMLTAISTVMNAIKTVITTVLTLVVNIFTNYVQAVALILQGMKNIFFAIFNGITQIITSTFNVIKGVITTILTGIKNHITLQLNYVKGTFQNILAFIKALVTLDFQGMWSAIKNQMTLILSTIKGVWQNVLGVFKGVNLFSVGADIMRGLLNGIKSMFSGIIGAVTDVVSGIKNKITGFFQIKSPSRVTTELGQFIGEGVAVGITDMKGAVDRSAEELSKAAKPELEPIDMPSLNVLDFNAEYNKRSVRGRTPQEDSVYSTEDETGKGIVIHIDKMEVRDDEDIVKVSRELESRIRRRRQSKGTA